MGTFTIYCKIPRWYILTEQYCLGNIDLAKEKQATLKQFYKGEGYKILRRGGDVFLFRNILSIQLEKINKSFERAK